MAGLAGIPGSGSLDAGDAAFRVKQLAGVSAAFAESASSIISYGQEASSDAFSIGADGSATPKLSVDTAGLGAPRPFQVCLVRRDDSKNVYGIFLPPGCLTVGGKEVPVSDFFWYDKSDKNKKKALKRIDKTGDDEEDPMDNKCWWYKYPFDEFKGDEYLNIMVSEESPRAFFSQESPSSSADSSVRIYAKDGNDVVFQVLDSPVVLDRVSSLAPFTVRWYVADGADDEDGEWQIYVPFGSVRFRSNVPGAPVCPCLCVNDDASGGSYGWYKIDPPKESEGATATIGGVHYQSVPVYALVKPWHRFKVSTDAKAYDTVLDYVIVGNMLIAKTTDDYGNEKTVRKGEGVEKTALTIEDPNHQETFNLVYEFGDSDAYDKGAKPKVKVVDLTFVGGRTVVTNDTDVDVTGWDEIWLKVDHDVSKVEDLKISVVKSGSTNGETSTYVKLFKLKDDVVVSDFRFRLNGIRFYDT